MNLLDALRLDVLRIPFGAPVRFGSLTTSSSEVGIVRLTTADGITGLGEIAGPYLTREARWLVDELAVALHGVDLSDTERLDDTLARIIGEIPQALRVRAAIETAALDVAARADVRPMSDLLGGRGRESIAVNGVLAAGRGTPESAADAARALVAAGFRTIKLKRDIGGEDFPAALAAIREAVGPDVALRLDLNGDLTEDGAIEWLGTLEWAGLEYVEQPVPGFLGPNALARVRRAVPMPIAADEAVSDPEAVADLLLADACDVMVVKPARVGGPRQAQRIVRAATASGVAVTISTLYETGIGLAAAAHVASAVPGARAHGLGTGGALESDLVGGALVARDGWLAVPDRSGLGVTLDEDAVRRYTVE